MPDDEIHVLPGGLLNIGNTCYANAIFQVLCHAPGFMNFLDSFGCSIQTLDDMRSVLKTHLVLEDCKEIQLPVALNFIFSMWKLFAQLRVCKTSTRPTRLLLLIRELNAEFVISQQHDAQELLMVILHVLLEAPDIACKYRDTLLFHARQMLHKKNNHKKLSNFAPQMTAKNQLSIDKELFTKTTPTKSILNNQELTFSTMSCSPNKTDSTELTDPVEPFSCEKIKALPLGKRQSDAFQSSNATSLKIRRRGKTVISSVRPLSSSYIDKCDKGLHHQSDKRVNHAEPCPPIKRAFPSKSNSWCQPRDEDKAWATILLAHNRVQQLKSLDVENLNPLVHPADNADSEPFRLRGGMRTLSLSRSAQPQPHNTSSRNPFKVCVSEGQILSESDASDYGMPSLPITLTDVVNRLSALFLSKNICSTNPVVGMFGSSQTAGFNYIAEHFQGQLRYTTQCLDCAEETVTWQPYNVISCPVPSPLMSRKLSFSDDDLSDLELNYNTSSAATSEQPKTSQRQRPPIEYGSGGQRDKIAQHCESMDNDCTLRFGAWPFCALREVETLSGDERFQCATCRHSCEARRVQEYIVTPDLLAFHLKRFIVNSSSSCLEKDTRPVNIPLELTLQDEAGREQRYTLYALVIHQGYAISSGHYICFVNLEASSDKAPLDACWICCDDEQVDLIDVAQLVCVTQSVEASDKTPYLVFYCRTSVTPNLMPPCN